MEKKIEDVSLEEEKVQDKIEVEETKKPEVKPEVEKFEVVKILNDKSVMARSLKTGKLFSKPNKKYHLKQIIK